jgi:aspartyl-tRNA(Asn)/glutamyl-tRNA(Gln) amidotransferase subunit B
VIASNTPQVEKYVGGNEKVFAFFVGETMRMTKGKANPGIVNDVLRKKLSARKR